MVNVLSIWSKLNEWSESLKAWIFEHYNNPLLWVGLVVGGLILFTATYNALHKD